VSATTPAQPATNALPDATRGTPGFLRVENLRKTYRLGRVPVPVLHGVDLSLSKGEWVAILGASGSGKSTLLHLAGGLDRPDRPRANEQKACRFCGYDLAGLDRERIQSCPECNRPFGPLLPPGIFFDGRDITAMGKGELDRYRAREVGFVFQFYHLLPELSVLQNVTVGAMIRHGRFGYLTHRRQAEARAQELLTAFGLAHRLRHRPAELSGGERQRVAIARALINGPRLLLADEPTGNLDRATGESILDALAGLRAETGLTVLMVTHDERVAERADRVVRLVDGRVAEGGLDGVPETALTPGVSGR
jgi:lipoprotein-releasing system ATP-binding protein